MGLSNELISQFAKITNDTKVKQTESTIYGTVSILDGRPWVKFDGSDRLTPADTTAAVADGERVMVTVKNHTATITGNVSSPAARNKDVSELSGKIDEFDTVIADKVKAETAEIETAIITKLDGKYATFEGLDATYASIKSLEAAEADIDTLQANEIVINEKLTARDAEIDQLKAKSLTVEVADAKYATIGDLEATNGKFNSLESTYGEFVDLTTEKFEALEGSIADLDVEKLDAKYATIVLLQSDYITAEEIATTYITASKVDADYAKISTLEANYIKTKDLEANYLTADIIKSKYAEIDLANVTIASIGTVLANAGLITSATIVDGHVTGYLDSVEVNANNITAGTLTVDRLIISGSDKSIIYAINNAGELVSAETDTINGDVITKRTIAADHIIAGAITANEIHSAAVTADKIATNAVTADKIAANAITAGKIAANAITADKIDVDDLSALDATIGGFNIGDTSIYSGEKSGINNASRGIYMGTDGQLNFGDANNYLKFYKDASNVYKLAIAAESITFGASGTSVEDAINEVQTSVDNIQVGGRNYILNSDDGYLSSLVAYAASGVTYSDENGWRKFTLTTDLNNEIVQQKYVTLSESGIYTFSILCKTDASSIQTYVNLYNGTHRGCRATVTYVQDNLYLISSTFNVPTDRLSFRCVDLSEFITVGATYVMFRYPKLEKGNKVTDWTPAPEDVDAKIDATVSTVDVMYAQNSSSTTAPTSGWATTAPTWTDGSYIWSKTVTTYVNGDTVESAAVCITGAKGATGNPGSPGSAGVGISSITELYYAGPSTTVPAAPTAAVTTNNASTYVSWNKAMPTYSASYPHYFTCSQVYYTNDTYKWTTPVYAGALTSANATANNAVDAVNNLQVGGRNLFRQSGQWTKLPTWWTSNGGGITLDTTNKYLGHNTLLTTVGDGIVGNNYQYFEVDVNKTYTFSVLMKSDTAFTGSASTPLHYHCSTDGSTNTAGITVIAYDQSIPVANTWKLLYLTFRPNGKYFRPFIYFGNHVSFKVNIAYLKLEEGNKPTDWTPAPEDVASDISSAQTSANNAQSTANTAIDNAAAAQTSANNAQSTANTASGTANTALTNTQKQADKSNYCQLNTNTAALWGFTYDSTADGRWYTKNGLARDMILSDTYQCKGGERFKITYEISTSVQGIITSGGSDIGYLNCAIGFACRDAAGSYLSWPIATSVKATAAATATSVSSIVTLHGGARQFHVHLTAIGWGSFSGTLKIRNVRIEKIDDEASKTATNHMYFASDTGLIVSTDPTNYATTNAGNVQIKSDGFRIRNGTTVNASFLGNTITLGQNSSSSYINMCGDKGQIKVGTSQWGDNALIMLSDDIELLSDTSTSLICKPDSLSDSLKSGYSYCHVYGSQMSAGYRPESTIGTYAVDSSSNARVSRLTCDITGMMLETNYAGGVNKNYLSFHYSNGGTTLYSTDKVTLKVHETGIDPYIEITDDTTNNSGYGKIYMTANNITLDPINGVFLSGAVEAQNNVYIVHNKGLYVKDNTGKDLVAVDSVNGAKHIRFGYGTYLAGVGNTEIVGNDIVFWTKRSSTSLKPYYAAGDSFSFEWAGAGFISSSSSKVYFTIPLAKPAMGNPTVTATSVSGLQIRQTTKYLYGSSASTYATPSSYSVVLQGENHIRVTATMPNTTNVVNNNETCGIVASIKITFS